MTPPLWVAVVLVLGTAVAALLGTVLNWTANNCYPWRRCGRCGQRERFAGRHHR